MFLTSKCFWILIKLHLININSNSIYFYISNYVIVYLFFLAAITHITPVILQKWMLNIYIYIYIYYMQDYISIRKPFTAHRFRFINPFCYSFISRKLMLTSQGHLMAVFKSFSQYMYKSICFSCSLLYTVYWSLNTSYSNTLTLPALFLYDVSRISVCMCVCVLCVLIHYCQ